MYFDGSFRFIGKVDPEPLARAIEVARPDAWSEYVRRQEMFQPHRNTETIPLLYDEDSRHTDPTVWPRYSELEPAMQPVLDTIREANQAAAGSGDGYFIRIILTRLKPHCWIPATPRWRRNADQVPSLSRRDYDQSQRRIRGGRRGQAFRRRRHLGNQQPQPSRRPKSDGRATDPPDPRLCRSG